VVRSGLSDLNEGQKVEYENEPGRQPGQVAAVNIRTL
jgi:cold shock CspA family protein